MKTLNETKLTAALILITGLFFVAVVVSAQPVRVNIKVNSTVGMQQVKQFEVTPENKVKTGMTVSDEKSRKVNANGAFMIKGKENCDVLVQLNSPDVLTNRENQTMPFNMTLAWHANTPADENKLKFTETKTNVFKFSQNETGSRTKNTQDDDRMAYIYLKGTADVPANSTSPFAGQIKLTIEY